MFKAGVDTHRRELAVKSAVGCREIPHRRLAVWVGEFSKGLSPARGQIQINAPPPRLLYCLKEEPVLPYKQIKTVHEIAPVFLKNEGRIEALFTLYFLALLVQALIERELRLAMKRDSIEELPIYPEQRQCRRPTTEQIQRLFSLAERHTLTLAGRTIEVFNPELTDLQRQVLRLLGVPHRVFQQKS
jgi:hypothetical protein